MTRKLNRALKDLVKRFLGVRKFPGRFTEYPDNDNELLGYITFEGIPFIEVSYFEKRIVFGMNTFLTNLEERLNAYFTANVIDTDNLEFETIDIMSIYVTSIIQELKHHASNKRTLL